MRSILAFLLLACAAAHAAPTQIPDAAITEAERLRDRIAADSGAYEIVESLTTEVGPRLAGTEADARAVEWAKAKFEALGFDRVTTEAVTFPLWRRGIERAHVTAPFPQPLHLTALGGSVGTDGVLEAEIVHFANIADLRAAPVDAATGKIVFISNRMQRARDGSGYAPAVEARSKGADEASRRGALGVLIRSIGTGSHRFPHTGNMRYAEDVRPIPAAALSNPDADLLVDMLRRGQPVRVRLELDVGTHGEYTSYNVIGDMLGRERPDEVVIIGAHLDSWDLGTGAIDDAAGIGITMAAAAHIGRLQERPRRTVRVVAFANEEQGLYGGKAYGAAHAAEIAQHIIGAESDFGTGRIYELRASVADHAWPAIERIAGVLAPLGIALEKNAKASSGADLLDITNRGMAYAHLAQDGTTYFDYHHTADDTLDKVDAKALDQQAAAYAVLAYLAAEAQGDFGSRPKAPEAGR